MVRPSRREWLVGAAALALSVVPARAAAKPLSVVCTTGMIADAARAIGGDAIAVRALMGPGIDPHAYRQTRSDIAAMLRADLVLRHGLYLEAQMEDFFERLGRKVPLHSVGEAVPEQFLIAHDDYARQKDPHVWIVPELWREAVLAVRDALISARPASKGAFHANAEAYLSEIDAVGTYASERLATVPEAARILVTAHDAFNYFGRAYGFDVVGIQGISTESEAGLSRIAELVDLLVERRVAAVFVESSVADRNIRALIEGAASREHEVRIGGELFSDAMGEDGTYEGSYIGMIDHNATVIARALGGEAPERGLRGRLAI